MTTLRTLLLAHWRAKLLSLAAATALWFGVTSAEQRVGVFPGGLLAEVVNIPAGLAAIADEREVNVTLVAEQTLWQRLTADDLRAEVNAAGLNAGVAELPVTVTSSVVGVEVIRINPPRILVRLEPIIEKTVPVSVRVTGQVADGFAPGAPSVSPSTVTVRGPASQLGQIDEVITRIHLSDDQRDLAQETPVVALIAGDTPADVTVSPLTVSTSVPVSRAANTKSVGVILSTEGTLPSGRSVSAVQLTPSIVAVTGPPASLASLTALTTAPIRLSDIEATTEVKTSLVLPDGVQLLDPVSTDISVILTISQASPPTPTTVDN